VLCPYKPLRHSKLCPLYVIIFGNRYKMINLSTWFLKYDDVPLPHPGPLPPPGGEGALRVVHLSIPPPPMGERGRVRGNEIAVPLANRYVIVFKKLTTQSSMGSTWVVGAVCSLA